MTQACVHIFPLPRPISVVPTEKKKFLFMCPRRTCFDSQHAQKGTLSHVVLFEPGSTRCLWVPPPQGILSTTSITTRYLLIPLLAVYNPFLNIYFFLPTQVYYARWGAITSPVQNSFLTTVNTCMNSVSGIPQYYHYQVIGCHSWHFCSVCDLLALETGGQPFLIDSSKAAIVTKQFATVVVY